MAKILQILRHKPIPSGRGGHHRAYQIYHDLAQLLGNDSVDTLSLQPQHTNSSNRIQSYQQEFLLRIENLLLSLKSGGRTNKIFLELFKSKFGKRNPFGKVTFAEYEEYLAKNGAPTACVIDNAIYLELIKYNQSEGIPTIYCPQNLDSFDHHSLRLFEFSQRINLAIEWTVELEALVSSTERLMISRLETSFLNGLGLSASYYPYIPKGELRQHLLNIRSRRNQKEIEPGLFMMIGSANHYTTAFGFQRFVEDLNKYGHPDSIRIVIGGKDTEKLFDSLSVPPCVEILGLLNEADLEDLYLRASGAIIPQPNGFGALTRLSELSCAGIPTLVSEHALNAMEIPPGVVILNDSWPAWNKTLASFKDTLVKNSLEDYLNWEERQVSPLSSIIQQYL